ncbi:MAG: phage tail protein [Chitinophagales bacterium]
MAQDGQISDSYPIAKFYFSVEIDGTAIAFQEVSGLDMETDVIEYRHGDSPVFSKVKMPGLIKTTNLVCKKGIFEGDDRLITEFQGLITDKNFYHNKPRIANVIVTLMNEDGTPIMIWTLTNAFPVKISGTDLKSDASEASIETLELAYEGMEISI